jgi:hypothetical protein
MNFLLDMGCQLQVNMPQLLSEWFSSFYQRNGVLNDITSICFQVIISPSENILKLSNEVKYFTSLNLGGPSSYFYHSWFNLCPYVEFQYFIRLIFDGFSL